MSSRWRDASSCVSGRTQLKKRKRPYACCKTHTREQINRRYAGMKEYRATKLIGILGVTGGLAILLGFSAERSHSTTPTVKVPGPHPYETPVQVPVPPPVSDSSPLPSPAPFRIPNLALTLRCSTLRFTNSKCPPPDHGKSRASGSIQIQWRCEFLWIPGSTSCQCQCIRSKTWNNTRA